MIIQAVHSARKLIQSKVLHDRSAKLAAHWFYSEWCMRCGFPAQITCDCEGAFISSFNTALTDLAGLRVHPTSSYNPMSCSQAENIHPRCTDMLRCLSNPEEPDCAEWVLEAHFAHKHCDAAHHAYLFVLPRVWKKALHSSEHPGRGLHVQRCCGGRGGARAQVPHDDPSV